MVNKENCQLFARCNLTLFDPPTRYVICAKENRDAAYQGSNQMGRNCKELCKNSYTGGRIIIGYD